MSRAAESLADPEIKAEWERETAAALKQLGFPVVDGPTSFMHLLPTASTCLTRRLAGLGEFLLELEKVEKEEDTQKAKKAAPGGAESILSKTFGCYNPLHSVCCLLCVSVVSYNNIVSGHWPRCERSIVLWTPAAIL